MIGSPGPTLAELARDLAEGRTSSRALAEACLHRIGDPAGEGARAFVAVDGPKVLAAADGVDALRRAGAEPSRFAGIPLAIKDLFDVRGEVTCAGSTVLSDRAPAFRDAPTIARLRRAGFVFVGRTNMTEFAYSGLGLNPHHGTPLSPWRRPEARIAGGSSSGSAVAVADGMAHAGLGTDTGGSCRIPAAFTGLVGYKPTARRVPLAGAVPLSSSLDSIGPIARSVACCATLDAILADEGGIEDDLVSTPLRGLRLAVPTTLVLDALDATVAAAFERALAALSRAGVALERIAVPEFGEVAGINAGGGFTAAESYAWHRDLIGRRRAEYDPQVASRIMRGAQMSAADYIDVVSRRASLVARATARLAGFDAVVMPTVPIVPPRVAELDTDEAFGRTNLLVLRNSTLINMIDGCAISIPIAAEGSAPVGLMVAAVAGSDRRLFAVAAAIESGLAESA